MKAIPESTDLLALPALSLLHLAHLALVRDGALDAADVVAAARAMLAKDTPADEAKVLRRAARSLLGIGGKPRALLVRDLIFWSAYMRPFETIAPARIAATGATARDFAEIARQWLAQNADLLIEKGGHVPDVNSIRELLQECEPTDDEARTAAVLNAAGVNGAAWVRDAHDDRAPHKQREP